LSPIGTNGSQLQVDITLIGDAVNMLPIILEALEHGGRNHGLKCHGKKIVFSIQSVSKYFPDKTWARYYEEEGIGYSLAEWLSAICTQKCPTWNAVLLSPLRLRKKNSYMNQLDWNFAFKTLAARLSTLNQLNGGFRMEKNVWDGLMEFFADSGRINTTTSRWDDWHRFSSTQKKHVPMGGRIDTVEVFPPCKTTEEWLHWWRTAEFLHLGKGTTMGNGALHLIYC
jgi:hypothetical protein